MENQAAGFMNPKGAMVWCRKAFSLAFWLLGNKYWAIQPRQCRTELLHIHRYHLSGPTLLPTTAFRLLFTS